MPLTYRKGDQVLKVHYSDCAVHNGPAYAPGRCDCGGV